MRVRAACRDDILRFCGGGTGGATVGTCLRGHVDELTGRCGDAVRAGQTTEEASKVRRPGGPGRMRRYVSSLCFSLPSSVPFCRASGSTAGETPKRRQRGVRRCSTMSTP